MSQEPRIVLNGINYLAEHKYRLEKKIDLARRVDAVEEFDIKKFEEKLHPRSSNGRFEKKVKTSKKRGGIVSLLDPAVEAIKEHTRTINCKDQSEKKVDGITVKGTVCTTKTKDGKTLSIYDDDISSISDSTRKEMLSALADLHELYPNFTGSTKIIVRNRNDPESKAGAAGWCDFKQRDRIYVNGDYAGWEPGSILLEQVMPAAKHVSHVRSIMFHEFGHNYDSVVNKEGQNNRIWGGATRKLHKDKNIQKHLTPYGRTNEWEGYAEAFQEWHLSSGKTKNPAARAYAKHQKWTTRFNLTSSGELFNITTFADGAITNEGIMVVDTFTLDPPPWFTGRVEFKPLSLEEDAQIDQIIKDTFNELDLPYEE